ncbi:MAG: exonuclease SbcCD subunit D [Dehalococcoidia bacterium]|nr:exonuclease SbcCD subunit D [Dehalococcoidia bacterium]
MKILHFADLHLGMETYGGVDPDTGLSTRLIDVLKALDEVVKYAVENSVDLVLFCGDAYKNRDPSQTQQREFAKRLRRLSENGIPVFLLVGNHDLPNAVGRANAVEIFDTLSVNHIHVGNRPDIYRVPTRHGNVQLVALPWLKRSALLSREETKNLSIEQANDRLQEMMTRRLLDLISELDPGLPTLLAAHIAVSTARPGSERSMVVGRDPVLLLGNVALPAFDYVALGHIHRHQVLLQSPPVVYAGSLERFDFGDEDEDKGFCVVDVEVTGKGKHVTYEFHKVNARRFVTVAVDIAIEDADPTSTVLRAINQQHDAIENAVVRVRICLPAALEASVRDVEINKALKEAHYAVVAKEIRQEARLRLGELATQGLSPIEALKRYLETKKVRVERQAVLLEYGEKLIWQMEKRTKEF